MTLQEKIDKLPLSIEYKGEVYNLRMYTDKDEIVLVYMLYNLRWNTCVVLLKSTQE